MRRVSVHHFVVTEITKPQSVAWRRSDLFGVSYWVDVPQDTEFPKTLARLHLFTRFYLSRAQPTDFRVRVVWLDRVDSLDVEIGNFGPFPVSFARTSVVHDCTFNLHNIRLEGVGRHRVELLRLRSTAFWEAAEWVVIAQTHFYVER
jgi:hypothetical protein